MTGDKRCQPIVERLREFGAYQRTTTMELAVICREAADRIEELETDNEGLKKALNAVSVPADVRKLNARIEELEAKTSLVTFNEACKRIEELEAALQEITRGPESLSRGIAAEALRGVARG